MYFLKSICYIAGYMVGCNLIFIYHVNLIPIMSESSYSPLGVSVSDVLGVALVGGILYVIYKSGVFKATQAAGSAVESASGVVQAAGTAVENWIQWLPLQPSYNQAVYGAGYATGEFLGNLQQNLTVGFAKLKGALGITT